MSVVIIIFFTMFLLAIVAFLQCNCHSCKCGCKSNAMSCGCSSCEKRDRK